MATKKQEYDEEKVELLTLRLGAVLDNTAVAWDMTVGEVMEALLRLFDMQQENK